MGEVPRIMGLYFFMTALQPKTKGKCAISTLIFRKFSGGYAPRSPLDFTPLGAPALRALLWTFGPSIVVSPLTKILAMRLTVVTKFF